MRYIILSAAVVIAFFPYGTTSNAHDLLGLIVEENSLDESTRQRFQEIDAIRNALSKKAAINSIALESVVQRTLLWDIDSIEVCFFDGAEAARDQVAEIAADWLVGTRLQLDFGIAGNRRTCTVERPSAIRISFEGQGYWSYVGTKARFVDPRKQTMNLEKMGSGATLTSDQRGTILHEFGHALAFEHEHQSPNAPCQEEYNWSYLYTAFANWSKNDIEKNLMRLHRSSSKTSLFTTDFDADSIMIYSLPAKAFLQGIKSKCYIGRKNTHLSPIDRATIQKLYYKRGEAPAGMQELVPDEAIGEIEQLEVLLK